ncbi:unnamed protein product [Mytilus coruscus]|uniref:Kringle domain-containing protein n=1 Tax=Mytilus coruscus TaxID=42192 RepID=A0A6J8A6A3_MYTCO|nr:unnamed protein product [Mytilus coruscus]
MQQECIRLNEMSNEHVYDFLEENKGNSFAKEARRNNQSLRRLMKICLVVIDVPNNQSSKTCVCESIDGRTSVQYTSITKKNVDTFNHCPVSFCVAGIGTWSLFDVAKSVSECYTTTSSGAGYKGKNTCTVAGRICQRWDRDYPQKRHQDHKPQNSQDLHSNFCRDPGPSYEYKPWCYTTDPNVRWENCHVPLC